MLIKSLTLAALGLGGLLPVTGAMASAVLLKETCEGCHAVSGGTISRISEQRKTPEAWHMTIFRMRHLHGLDIDSKTQRTLIQYLSDTQGMAPSETNGLRYAFDRNPAAQESMEGPIVDYCGRCHTTARVALQRRTEEEWRLHVDFHIGQYPTTEYQAGGRDREWYKNARDEIVPMLAKAYPLKTDAWDKWQAAEKPSATGAWVVSTLIPGNGPAFGTMTVEDKGESLTVTGSLQTAGGESLPLSGTVNIYTGYEWRASVKLGDTAYRQVLALSEDGNTLTGRHYLKGQDAMNREFSALKVDAPTMAMAVVPENVRAGEQTDVFIIGSGLKDAFTAAEGVTIVSQQATDFGAKLTVKTSADSSGPVTLSSGSADAYLLTYHKIDRLTVEPAYAVARVGGGGGSAPPANAMFDSIGWLNGSDGQAETEDDVRIGLLSSSWELADFDEVAEELKDKEHVGTLDVASGVFMPAVAGPNANRPFSTNNAGNTKVIASFDGVKAEAQMIVTVQRWNDPPLR